MIEYLFGRVVAVKSAVGDTWRVVAVKSAVGD
jgi:hypothetical protein